MILAIVDHDAEHALLGVTGIVWDVGGPGRVDARLERWWVRRDADGWHTADGARPVRRADSVWWSTRR
jgi:hypothetical protein